MQNLTKFNTENFDLITQLIFHDNINTNDLRICKFLDIPKISPDGKRVKRTAYSARGIAVICGISTASAIRSLRKLQDMQIVVLYGSHYSLNFDDLEFEVLSKNTESDPKVDQLRSKSGSESDPKVDHNNNKEIIINNNTLIKEQKIFCEIEKIHIADANKFLTNKDLHDALPENIAKLICQKFENNKELIRIGFRLLLCELQSERNLRGMTPEQCYRFLDKSWVRQEILKEFSAQKGAEVALGKQNYYKAKAIPSPENKTHGQAYKPFKSEVLDLPKNPKVKELLSSILGTK